MNKQRVDHLIREGFNCYKFYMNETVIFDKNSIDIEDTVYIDKETGEFINKSNYPDSEIRSIIKKYRWWIISLYRMTIESMSSYNPNYIELINPKFERSLFKRFKEWQKTQKNTWHL